ncbi:MAG: aminopeptidase, partial [Deltaproteobacteria bacterium]
MLTKKQLEKYSDVLMWGLKAARTQNYKKGDIVLVQYDPPAVRLAECLQANLLKWGMIPVLRSGPTTLMEQNFYDKANQKQLTFLGSWEKDLCQHLNGRIFLHAPGSLTHLKHIDPKRIGKEAVAKKPLRDIMRKREEKGELGWTLCMVPTEALAKQANITLRQYTNQVIKACYLDKPDPVKEWKQIYRKAIALKKWLNQMDVTHCHVESDNTDLLIKIGEKRQWSGISGHNIPSFELFLSPDWRGTKGVYYADQPSFRSGNYV